MKMLNPRAALVLSALAVFMPAAARADVTISTATTGPVVGDGGTFTVTTAGSITGGAAGIIAMSDGAITTLTIDGQVSAFFNGVDNYPGSTITSINISGTVDGDDVALMNRGTVGSLTMNVGSRLAPGGGTGIKNEGTFTGTISNAGTMRGYGAALDNQSTGQIFAFTNSGLVTAEFDAAVKTTGTITTLTNLAGGHLQGEGYGLLVEAGGGVGTIVNSGSITGYNGISSNGGITTLTNSGILTGGYQGIGLGANASVGSFTNSGLVSGGGDWGMGADAGATIGMLTNSGTFTGFDGISSSAVTGTMRNLAGGLIEGPGNSGLRQFATLTLLENSGSITGLNAIETGADIGTIDNQAGGLIGGVDRGLWLNSASHTVTTVSNAGTIQANNAVENYGAITDFTNSGLINGTVDWGIYHGSGSLGTLTNTASGTISGGSRGIGLISTTGTLTNAGSITSPDNGILTQANVGTIDNQAGGLISGGNRGLWLESASHTVTTITNEGTIQADNAIVSQGAIGTLTNSGTVQGMNAGVLLDATSTTGTISNPAGGLMQAANYGLYTEEGASIVTLTNAGTVQGTNFGMRLFGTTGTVANSGTIQGDYGFSSIGSLNSFTNSSTGVVRGVDGPGFFSSSETLATFTNEAGGLIETTNDGFAAVLAGTVTTATNAGMIRSANSWALVVNNATSLTNSGTLSGSRGMQKNGPIGTLTNAATGLIEGTEDGIYTSQYDDNGEIVNAGRITGGRSGIYAYYGIGNLTNQSGGEISGTTGAGVYLEDRSGTITNEAGGLIESANAAGVFVGNYSAAALQTLSNDGTIEGVTAGVSVANGGTIKKLINTRTIRYTGEGTGPAVFVGSGGVLGDVTGARGVALSSTGTGALLDGTIVNQGTIWYGFTIENQNVVISAAGDPEDGGGGFADGLLNVVDGDLTFLDGRTLLGADIAVNGGDGTVFNEGVLAFADERNVNGAFSQSSGGTLSSIVSDTNAYGSIVFGGAAFFAGTLDLDVVGFEFTLDAGQRYDLFSFASTTGEFTGLSVDGVALASAGTGKWAYGSLTLEEIWTPTSMSIAITAVPEPSTIALAVAGLACGYVVRPRRKRA